MTGKFRGKRTDTGEWVHGYLIGKDVIVGEIVEWDSEYFNTEFWYKVMPETVGRYVELKDRNNIEVYEGDIIQDDNGKPYLIKWGVNMNGFYARSNDMHSSCYSSYHLAPKTIIIGNIHDNPRLIRR